VADGGGLENRYGVTPIVGSNPTPSAPLPSYRPVPGAHVRNPALTLLVFLLAFGVVTVCAAIHGSVGFGLNLLAVPLLLLVDPALVPGPALAAGLVMAVLVAGRELGAVDPRTPWAVVGLVPGTVAGVALLAVVPDDALGVALGALVLAAVVLSARAAEAPGGPGQRPPCRPRAVDGGGPRRHRRGTPRLILPGADQAGCTVTVTSRWSPSASGRAPGHCGSRPAGPSTWSNCTRGSLAG
jgi:hypothetical protein